MQGKQIGIIVALYLAIASLSFGIFRLAFGSGALKPSLPGAAGGLANLISPVVPSAGGGLGIDTNAPKTEVCPINGKKFTKAEKEAWDKRRVLMVMIENHEESRPQSGLNTADAVYETVAEGGITRFMGVFYCAAQAQDAIVAPVRSARQLWLDYASEYSFPLYAHVGGANNYTQGPGEFTDPRVQALEHIGDYGWQQYNDIDQMSVGYPTFVRNYNRIPGKDIATEHTMESSTYRLWDFAATKRNLTNLGKDGRDWKTGFIPWEFQDEAAEANRGTVSKIAYDFWSGVKGYDVSWAYDKASNDYLRSMAGQPHLDMNDQKQVNAKNVVVLYTKEYPSVDTHKHVFYQTIGTGKAIIFQNGNQEEVTWSKKDRLSRLTFIDKKGRPVKFVRGRIWITVLATGNDTLSTQ